MEITVVITRRIPRKIIINHFIYVLYTPVKQSFCISGTLIADASPLFNRYHGLPQPDNDTLLTIVKSAPDRAFRTDWHLVEGGIKEMSIPTTPAFKWHNAKSFSFPVRVNYKLRWDNVHTVDCTREWDVRVYRMPDGNWGNPSGMHARAITACRT